MAYIYGKCGRAGILNSTAFVALSNTMLDKIVKCVVTIIYEKLIQRRFGLVSNPHFPRKETVAPMIDPGGIHDETEK